MAVTVKVVILAGSHVECTVNGPRRAALGAIEGKIPTATAVAEQKRILRLPAK